MSKFQMTEDPIQSFPDKAVSPDSTELDMEEKDIFYRAYYMYQTFTSNWKDGDF